MLRDHVRMPLVMGLWHQIGTTQGVPNVGRVLTLLDTGLVPSAILIDVRLLGEPGWILAEHLHQKPATTDIPVILVAGGVGDAARALRLGARQFLSNPVTPGDIVAAVGEFCPRSEADKACASHRRSPRV